MTRRAATALHVTLILIGALLYFFFVIPRWWVLIGDIPGTLATTGRIAAGVPIALAAVPVVLLLQRSIEPTENTPELALRFRAWSALLLVVGGALILVPAIAEIWLGLGAAGVWLFAVYGAAGAIAILGVLAYSLSFVAEKPPAEPKAPKPKKEKRRRGKRGATPEEADADLEPELETDTQAEPETDTEPELDTTAVEVTDADITELTDTETVEASATVETSGGLRNKRPTGKRRYRLNR